MKKLSVYLIAVLALCFSSSVFAKGVKLGLVGTANMTKERTNEPAPASPRSYSYEGEMGYGGGAIVDFGMSQHWDFEIGGLYYEEKPKKLTDNSVAHTEQTDLQKHKVLEVPILFRYWFGRVVSFGLGGFYKHYMSNPTNTVSIKNTTTNAAVGTATTTDVVNTPKYNAGLEASLGIDLPLSQRCSFMIDGRYQFGMVNQETSASAGWAYKYDSIQALAGLRFML